MLAKTECTGILNSGEWQHLTLTYTESKLPDKVIIQYMCNRICSFLVKIPIEYL